jgi:hypothetical protein
LIPANLSGSQCTKIISTRNIIDTIDVVTINLIRALQDIFNLETMTPPSKWPTEPPGIKITPTEKEGEKHS